MAFKEWKRKIQAQNLARLTPEQRAKMIATTERRWRKMQARGLAFFLVTRTAAMFVWMCVCLAGFTTLGHTWRVARQAFYLESVLPCMMILALSFSVTTWVVTRMNARNLREWRGSGRI